MKEKQRFSDLDPLHKTATVVGAIVQLSLAAAAWRDLTRRPADTVRGRKGVWAAVIAVNYVGPIAYFSYGRLPHR